MDRSDGCFIAFVLASALATFSSLIMAALNLMGLIDLSWTTVFIPALAMFVVMMSIVVFILVVLFVAMLRNAFRK